ncbi:MAG: metal ABC transporter permease [Verrucomicrobiales bacterium]|nr:metal ABC transporter permease [Verrucomicrobiales bacterium]
MAILTEPFMQRALIGALILAPLCALLGVFVTARRMAFFSDTVAHASLAGTAVAFLIGLSEPTPGMLAVSLLVAAAIVWLREKSGLYHDTIMALLLTGSVAVGTVILSRLRGFRGEIHRVLFGDILAVGTTELALAALLLGLVVVGAAWVLSPLTLIAANEDLAHVAGVPVRWFNYAFVVVLTVAVTITIRLVGILLVGALLVIPPAAARLLSRNLRQEIWIAIALGAFSGTAGVVLSYVADLPCGPAIVLFSITLFIVALATSRMTGTQSARVGAKPS